MPYDMLVQRPESSVVEKWTWWTDSIMSDNGTVTTASIRTVPKRLWTGKFRFDSLSTARRHVATMFQRFGSSFLWPLAHQSVVVKLAVTAGSSTVYCNTSRSDFRAGAKAFLSERASFEEVTILAVYSDRVTTTAPLVNSYTQRASISPVALVYSSEGANFARGTQSNIATADFNFYENGFLDPFILEDKLVELTTFDSLPLLDKRPIGTNFPIALVTGLEVTDYGGKPSLRSRWASSQYQTPLNYQVNRTFEPESWNWWKSLFDYCLGSTNPFYLPSYSNDFAVHTEASAAGTTVTFEGHSYAETYYTKPSFRGLVFTATDGSRHYVKATNVANSGGNDQVTFAPELPAGDWAGQTVGLLLQCRISDDIVSTEHFDSHSIITVNVRTTD